MIRTGAVRPSHSGTPFANTRCPSQVSRIQVTLRSSSAARKAISPAFSNTRRLHATVDRLNSTNPARQVMDIGLVR
jgi:hypothetical protein